MILSFVSGGVVYVDDLGHFGEPSIVTFSSILGGAVTGAPGEAGLTAMSAGVASTERAGPGCLNSARGI